jgi:hypothetical protein
MLVICDARRPSAVAVMRSLMSNDDPRSSYHHEHVECGFARREYHPSSIRIPNESMTHSFASVPSPETLFTSTTVAGQDFLNLFKISEILNS